MHQSLGRKPGQDGIFHRLCRGAIHPGICRRQTLFISVGRSRRARGRPAGGGGGGCEHGPEVPRWNRAGRRADGRSSTGGHHERHTVAHGGPGGAVSPGPARSPCGWCGVRRQGDLSAQAGADRRHAEPGVSIHRRFRSRGNGHGLWPGAGRPDRNDKDRPRGFGNPVVGYTHAPGGPVPARGHGRTRHREDQQETAAPVALKPQESQDEP